MITLKKKLIFFKNMLIGFMVLLSVGILIFTIVSLSTVNHIDRNLFGYKSFVVLSNSMSATDFSAGDLVITKQVDPADLKAGDIISFQSTNKESYGEVVTHKIREVRTDNTGNPLFVTYGTTTNTDDKSKVAFDRVLGKYEFRIVGIGSLLQFLKTVPGYILCIFIPFFVLILIQVIETVRKFRAYKKKQLAIMRIEWEHLQAEKAESMKMIEELKRLKQEVNGIT